MDKVLFIINASAAQAQNTQRAIEKLFDSAEIRIELTQHAGHAMELANNAVTSGIRKIISAGGDGSLNEVLNGMLNASVNISEKERANLRLGIIPIGTGNDYIRTTGSPARLADLKQSIVQDNVRKIDVGLASYYSEEKQQRQRYFINIVDVGLGGLVARQLQRSRRFLNAFLTYQKVIISSLLSYQTIDLSASIDDFTYRGKTMLIAIANGKYFGSGIGIAPDADPSNGMFAVVVVGDVSKWKYIQHIDDARKCRHLNLDGMIYRQAASIHIESCMVEFPVDMDGEFVGYGPIEVRMVPGAIDFYV